MWPVLAVTSSAGMVGGALRNRYHKMDETVLKTARNEPCSLRRVHDATVEILDRWDAQLCAADYLSDSQIHLLDNPLLCKP
jgi:NAD dependent epimerase/dehydratase family enzyme